MSNEHALSSSARAEPTLGARIYKAGEMALAGFSGPAAGVLGCAAMYGSAMLISKWTGNNSGGSLQGLQGLLGLAVGSLLSLSAVGAACAGAVKGFIGKNLDQVASFGDTIKESAVVAASGVGVAVATGGAIMGVNGLIHIVQGASSPWVIAPAVAAIIVTGLASLSGSVAGPLGMALAGLDSANKALDGHSIDGAPVVDVAGKLRKARQDKSQSAQPAIASISAARMA